MPKIHYNIFNYQESERCSNNFDGSGGVLGYAYYPNNDECREIHFGQNEKWNFELDKDVSQIQRISKSSGA